MPILFGGGFPAPRHAILAALTIVAALLWLAPAEPAHAQTDNTRPTITLGPILNSPASGDTYRADEPITFNFTFSEPVVVSGKPCMRFTVGSKKRWAQYSSTTGGDTLAFTYTVKSDDRDDDGISLARTR